VDVVHFVDSARQLLPDAILSLGWTQSEDWAAVNRLDWRRAFQLLQLLLRRRMDGAEHQPPVILTMRLNDAVHSAEVRPNFRGKWQIVKYQNLTTII
jgi:hypothetical protein